jgi:hypothetical protein
MASLHHGSPDLICIPAPRGYSMCGSDMLFLMCLFVKTYKHADPRPSFNSSFDDFWISRAARDGQTGTGTGVCGNSRLFLSSASPFKPGRNPTLRRSTPSIHPSIHQSVPSRTSDVKRIPMVSSTDSLPPTIDGRRGVPQNHMYLVSLVNHKKTKNI